MKRAALYICTGVLLAALLLAAGRHDARTVHQLLFSYSGLAGLCGMEKRKKKVTDRQHRRRARGCIEKDQLKRCAFCGSKRNMRVHHLNGIESDNNPANLVGACHACNTRIGWLLKRHNIGRRVDLEYNPAQPARTLAQMDDGGQEHARRIRRADSAPGYCHHSRHVAGETVQLCGADMEDPPRAGNGHNRGAVLRAREIGGQFILLAGALTITAILLFIFPPQFLGVIAFFIAIWEGLQREV